MSEASKQRRFFERQGTPPRSLRVEPDIVEFAAICDACGHVAEVPRKTLREHGCNDLTLKEIGPRLICSACGARNGRLAAGFFEG